MYLRDFGGTEVGGFGICPNHPLLVEDVQLVKQSCSMSTVAFDDESVADFFEDQVENGLQPEQFARVWIHTHPGLSADPSLTDEETFARVFGSTNSAVMFILACGGETYSRMRDHGALEELLMETQVDFSIPFSGSQFANWEAEYKANIIERSAPFYLEDVWDLMEANPVERDLMERDLAQSEGRLDEDQFLNLLIEEEYYYDHFEPSEPTGY